MTVSERGAIVVFSVLATSGCGSASSVPVERRPLPVSSAATAPPFHVAPMLVANGWRTCRLASNGVVACWGDDLSDWAVGATTVKGILAKRVGLSPESVILVDSDGRTRVSRPKTRASDASAFSDGSGDAPSVDASCDDRTCCRVERGEVACSGSNSWDRLGRPGKDAEVFVPVAGTETATAVATGVSSACALLAAKRVVCWGSNEDGEIGIGSSDRGRFVAKQTVDLPDVSAIAAGYHAACALTETGKVWCWGSNMFGLLGSATAYESNAPVAIAGIPTAAALSLGGEHACILGRDGTVWCWGQGDDGQIGVTQTKKADHPVRVAGIDDAVAIASGEAHSCALRKDESVSCWGQRTSGQLGDGDSSRNGTPIEVPDVAGAKSACAQSDRTCAVDADKNLVCWGDHAAPQSILTNAIACDAHCVLQTDGKMACDGTAPELDHVTATSTTLIDGCALRDDASVRCWNTTSPAKEHFRDAVDVITGNEAGCAIKRGGELWCWGNVARRSPPIDPAVKVDGVDDAIDLAADDDLSLGGGLVLHRSGAVDWFYWAMAIEKEGHLDLRRKPLEGVTDAVAMTGGPEDGCVVVKDGRVACWGGNEHGQDGDGTTVRHKKPVFVRGIDDAIGVTSGRDYRCAARKNGHVSCWGNDDRGQLGRKFVAAQATPVAVVFAP